MKIGIRKLYYAADGSYEYQERVEIWRCYYSGKHGRYKKDKRLSKHARYLVKRGVLDGIDLIGKNFNDE